MESCFYMRQNRTFIIRFLCFYKHRKEQNHKTQKNEKLVSQNNRYKKKKNDYTRVMHKI